MSAPAPDSASNLNSSLFTRLSDSWDLIEAGASARLERLSSIGTDFAQLVAPGRVDGGFWTILALAILVSIIAIAAGRVAETLFVKARGKSIYATLVFFIVGMIVSRLAVHMLTSHAQLQFLLLPIRALALLGVLVPAFLTSLIIQNPDELSRGMRAHMQKFVQNLSIAVQSGMAGYALLMILRMLGASYGLRDLAVTVLFALPMTILLVRAYWISRRPLALLLAGLKNNGQRFRWFGKNWPGIAIVAILIPYVIAQLSITVSRPASSAALPVTLVLALLAPHFDHLIARWASSGENSARSTVMQVAIRRTVRFAAILIILSALIAVWSEQLATLTGYDFNLLAWSGFGLAATLMISAFMWNLVGAATDRALTAGVGIKADHSGDEGGSAPQSRLNTLLPLLAGTARVGILMMAGLTILLTLGINVWPLVTGLSVFGLAIGFGTQTLVKDIVSGLFFLFDDAFRLGEYIECSGATGTVEKISIRSMSMRHPRGAMTTIPYGQIEKIQNFSRDWAIEKINFRVAFDTDTDLVKRTFREIGQNLLANEDLRPKIIETFKSQGIYAVEDGTLLIRGKFKARAGQQHDVRKAVLLAVHRAFREKGIVAVSKPLVQLPTQ